MKMIAVVLLGAALAAAQNPSTKPAPTASAQAVPAGATLVEPNLYRLTDAQGKTWMYRRTPFGISKWQEDAVPQTKAPDADPPRVSDLGDSFQFERATPFGSTKWTKKKSDLTAEEKTWADALNNKVPETK
jgi:hypothetical protein